MILNIKTICVSLIVGASMLSAATYTNVSTGKPSDASSSQGSYTAAQGNDDNSYTRWGSSFYDYQWYVIDLQTVESIGKFKISWEAAYATEYKILLSTDNVNWDEVEHNTQGTGGTIEHYQNNNSATSNYGSYRYAKIELITRKTNYGFSFYEFKVYKTDVGGGGGNASYQLSKFVDHRDGQRYNAVTIGTQTWMAENLNFSSVGNFNFPSYCYEKGVGGSTNKYCETYGRLYDWYTAMSWKTPNNQGICPDNWHIPSVGEWDILINYVDANNGSNGPGLSLKSTYDWGKWGPNGNGTDAFGFTALPAGVRWKAGDWRGLSTYASWWTSEEVDAQESIRVQFTVYDGKPGQPDTPKSVALPIRCIKN
ncbi:MAG: discoidin domain-containing protein [Fibrobacterales bacterium]